MLSSLLLALIFGILGVILDKRKAIAIIAVIIAAGIVALYVIMQDIPAILAVSVHPAM